MTSILGAQNIYLDKSSVEHHRRIFEIVSRQSVKKEEKIWTKEDCDAKYFDTICLHTILRTRLPLLFILKNPIIDLNINMVIGKIKGDRGMEGDGVSSIKTRGEKRFDLLSRSKRMVLIQPRVRNEHDDLYSKWTEKASRPNSIESRLNALERGGSTRLSTDALRHLVFDRLSLVDTHYFLAMNCYMYLQKCILYYSCEGLDVMGSKIDYEIIKLSVTSIYQASTNCDMLINVDSFTDLEMSILVTCLKGHQSVRLSHSSDGELVDIYSKVVFKPTSYMLCTEKYGASKRSIVTNVMGPELALVNIYSLMTKLGALRDWLECPDLIRGIATYNNILGKFEGGSFENDRFSMDVPNDRSYGTVFNEICNQDKNMSAEHTNLGASSVNLVLDIVMGQSFLNNFHYLSEKFALLNPKLYNTLDDNDTMYISMMNEMGMFREGRDNKMNSAIFAQVSRVSLYGNVRSMKRTLETYVNLYRKGKVNKCSDLVWLQINSISGSVFNDNSSVSYGQKRAINARIVGPLVSDLDLADRTLEWMMMHQLTRNRTIGCGMSTIGCDPLSSTDQSIYSSTIGANGIYECRWVELNMDEEDFNQRSGYDSNTMSDLHYTLSYFSRGRNKSLVSKMNASPVVDSVEGKQTIVIKETDYKLDEARNKYSEEIKNRQRGRKYSQIQQVSNITDTTTRDITGTLREDVVAKSTGKLGLREAIDRAKNVRKDKQEGTFSYQEVLEKLRMEDKDKEEASKDKIVQQRFVVNEPKVKESVVSRFRSQFEIEKQKGDGNCLAHTITSFYDHEGRLNECIELADKIGWKPNGTWEDASTALAFNQMMGYNTMLVTPQDEIIVSRVANPRGVCWIDWNGNHFDLMLPIDTPHASRDKMIEVNYLKDGIVEEVMERYVEFLNEHEKYSAVKSDESGRRVIVTSFDEDKLIEVKYDSDRERDWNRRGDDPFTYGREE